MSHSETIYILCAPETFRQANLQGQFTTDSLATEGFIHASPGHQLNRVANAYFPEQSELLLLSVAVEALQAELRWEPSTHGELYPHLYGPLNLEAIVQTDLFRRQAHGGFEIRIP
ncbi:DUF952 domain-containing protein [Vampirovibrio chlorellavorus]|uniref:DUF952 domain-containing protein n=1 Tax=Vampirovibrio chlorellavorus TaxID=758823 RepID=UPI0026EE4491|nr:DUF952 domain-containing protein [Vampirovibrio chlorellavorus]